MHMEWWVWSQTGIPKPNRLRYYLFCETNIAAATDQKCQSRKFLSPLNYELFPKNLTAQYIRSLLMMKMSWAILH